MPDATWLPVYRQSLYALPWPDGQVETWCGFSLDAEPKDGPPDFLREVLAGAASGTLITAWNPYSEERPLAENEAANAAMAALMREAGLDPLPALGLSLPGVEPAWRERGFFLRGLSLEQAISWAFYAKQRALVYWTDQAVGLLFCRTATFHPCGARQLEVPAELLASEPTT